MQIIINTDDTRTLKKDVLVALDSLLAAEKVHWPDSRVRHVITISADSDCVKRAAADQIAVRNTATESKRSQRVKLMFSSALSSLSDSFTVYDMHRALQERYSHTTCRNYLSAMVNAGQLQQTLARSKRCGKRPYLYHKVSADKNLVLPLR